jgi:preprotein translocase subunit YajC
MSLMDLLISPAAAQAAGAPAGQPSLLSSLALPALFFVVVLFLMIRPQMKRAKEHKELISRLAKGDEVITNGGIAGRVAEIGDSFITLEVADNVRIKLQRSAIVAVLPKDTLKSA